MWLHLTSASKISARLWIVWGCKPTLIVNASALSGFAAGAAWRFPPPPWTSASSKGYNDSMTLAQRAQTLEQLSRQRWKDAENGTPAYQPPYNELKGGEVQFLVEYADYYRTPRGYHPRSVNSGNAWTMTTPLAFMNLPILTYIQEIAPRPLLLIHGENAHSRYFSETAFASAAEPKELVIIPDAVHVDLYDQMDKIPFDKLTAFFQQHLI